VGEGGQTGFTLLRMTADPHENRNVSGARLTYLDNLKVLLVAGVIAVHSAITYGVDGSWYLEDYESMTDVAVGLLTVFVAVGFLFGLGAFFLIAGRLSGPSLDRKGPRRFARDRLLRLGIPVLFYVTLIAPVMEYVKFRDEGGDEGFLSFAWSQLSDPAPGPTWFLEALLLFSLVYALVRVVRPERQPVSRGPLSGRSVIAVGAAIAALSFRHSPRRPVRGGAPSHPIRALPAVRDPVRARLRCRSARLARDADARPAPRLRSRRPARDPRAPGAAAGRRVR
jgi:peptidoglycan/LPS O-acetylase OafA/YrhL